MTSNAQKPEVPDPGFWTTFKDTGGTAMGKHWRDRFELEDFGAWTFMVRGGNAGSSWTTDPVLLKGFWYLSSSYMSQSFGSMGAGDTKGETLLQVQLGIKVLCTCFGCMTCSFGLLFLKSNSVSHETE